MNYSDWLKEVRYLRDKILLPNGRSIDKVQYLTENGFSEKRLSSRLFEEYNKEYPIKEDGRRYKK